jgi:hypothetical protein
VRHVRHECRTEGESRASSHWVGDNPTHTARTLGISVRALQKKIGKYGLPPRE